jgi:hypothetical protein
MPLIPALPRLLLMLLALLTLAGCAAFQRSPVRTDVRVDDVALRAVLAYARSADDFDSAARARELRTLEREAVTPIRLMKLAVLHGQNRNEADPAKGAALLEKVMADTSPDAAVFHPLARILHAQYLARVRLLGQNERLLKEHRDAREQMDDLQQKLDALTDIERSLPAPASRPMESVR